MNIKEPANYKIKTKKEYMPKSKSVSVINKGDLSHLVININPNFF